MTQKKSEKDKEIARLKRQLERANKKNADKDAKLKAVTKENNKLLREIKKKEMARQLIKEHEDLLSELFEDTSSTNS